MSKNNIYKYEGGDTMTIIDLREYMSSTKDVESVEQVAEAYHSDSGADLCNWDDVDCCVGGYSD